jgi:twinkle protein
MMTAGMMDVLSARGLDVELLDKLGCESRRVAGGERLAVPFMRDGQVLKTKLWNPAPKEGEAKWTAVSGGRSIAFNEDCLRDDSLIGLPVIITEGEFDCVAALQSGFARTISVPDGAPQEEIKDPEAKKYAWIEEVRPLLTLERVSEYVLATDADGPGAALLQDLANRLGRPWCKFVTYPIAPVEAQQRLGRQRCKDLNEVLEFYGPKGVQTVIERATWLRIDGVFRMSERPQAKPITLYEPRGRLLRENMKLRAGGFMVVTGTPGFGKTTWVNDIMCGASVDYDLTVAWASFEQEPETDHKRNLRSWFCEDAEKHLDAVQLEAADRWIDAKHLFIVPTEDEDATLDWLLDKMEVAVCRYGAKIIVIDPWNEIEHCRRPGETETEYTNRAIRVLKRFGKRFGVLVVVIAHPTKSAKDGEGNYKMPTLYDISGSANWFNKADIGVVVHRHRPNETHIFVQKIKFHQIMGKPGTVAVDLNVDSQHYHELERVA